MSDLTKSVVSELRRLNGDWIFKGWHLTFAWHTQEKKWYAGLKHKRQEA